MRWRSILTLAGLLVAGALIAQEPGAPAPAAGDDRLEPLLFLVGSWEGEGVGPYGPYSHEMEVEREGDWLVVRTTTELHDSFGFEVETTARIGFDEDGQLVNHSMAGTASRVDPGRIEGDGVTFESVRGGDRRGTRITRNDDGSLHFLTEIHLETPPPGEPRDTVFESVVRRRDGR